MQVKDVMGMVAIAVRQDASFAELVATMQRFKVGAVAVIDADRRPVGVVSEDDLLLKETSHRHGEGFFPSRRRRQEQHKAAGAYAGQIMSSPAITVTAGTPVREAARLMHDHRIKQLPVIDAVTGKIVGTVHQGDLLKVFMRSAADLRREVVRALAGLGFATDEVTVAVKDGVVTLGGQVALCSQIAPLVAAVEEVDGVTDVEDAVTYTVDDLVAAPLPYL
ncbi:CBS domain-containing protein [Planobispora takensis]|uniref:CBS domain-containing protein n=1 Tax=Planobispora takensis TaxID=1367882 RepID=UPI0019457D79|nr:CBS domain-containing protein [Planobispora takensis]